MIFPHHFPQIKHFPIKNPEEQPFLCPRACLSIHFLKTFADLFSMQSSLRINIGAPPSGPGKNGK
jgi:hypothetical protein